MTKQEEINAVVCRISRKDVVKYGLPGLKPDYKILGWDDNSAHLLIGRTVALWQPKKR